MSDCSKSAVGPLSDVAYLDRSSPNWGAFVGAVFAVPAAFAWMVIELVGGALVCESVDGPCGPSLIDFLVGLTVIAVVACAVGWIFNRAIDLIIRAAQWLRFR